VILAIIVLGVAQIDCKGYFQKVKSNIDFL